jgi:hypothetical protein
MVALYTHDFWFTSVGLASIIRLCNTRKVWNGWTECLEHWVNVKLCYQFGQLTLKYLHCFWLCVCKNNISFRDVSVTLLFGGRFLNWEAISAMNVVQHCSLDAVCCVVCHWTVNRSAEEVVRIIVRSCRISVRNWPWPASTNVWSHECCSRNSVESGIWDQ